MQEDEKRSEYVDNLALSVLQRNQVDRGDSKLAHLSISLLHSIADPHIVVLRIRSYREVLVLAAQSDLLRADDSTCAILVEYTQSSPFDLDNDSCGRRAENGQRQPETGGWFRLTQASPCHADRRHRFVRTCQRGPSLSECPWRTL